MLSILEVGLWFVVFLGLLWCCLFMVIKVWDAFSGREPAGIFLKSFYCSGLFLIVLATVFEATLLKSIL